MNPVEVRTQFEEGFAELRKWLSMLDPVDLPFVPIQGGSLDLPKVSCVYFVLACAGPPEILYIGKAGNLRSRWSPNTWTGYHTCHLPALKLNCCRLAWWELGKTLTNLAEPLLIDIHRPPWNSHGNAGGHFPFMEIEDWVTLDVEPTTHDFRQLAQPHLDEIRRFVGTNGPITYEHFRRWLQWRREQRAGDTAGVRTIGPQGESADGAEGPAR